MSRVSVPKKMQSIFFKHYLTQGDQVMKTMLTTAKGFQYT